MSFKIAIKSLGNFNQGKSDVVVSFRNDNYEVVQVSLRMDAAFDRSVDEFREIALTQAIALMKSVVSDLEAKSGAQLNALEKEGGS